MSSSSRSGSGARRARRAKRRERSGIAALALAIVGVLLPGVSYLAAGRRRLGTAVTLLSLSLYGAAVYLALARRDDVVTWALNPDILLWMVVGLGVIALYWVAVLVSSYKMLRPMAAGPGARLAGSAVIGLVCFGMASSTALGAQTLMAQRQLVEKVFSGDSSKSQTRPKIKNTKDPWAQLPRLNILLLGADDGAGRQDTRTDSVMIASIDTRTGKTALISLSRNWMRMPFPAGTALHKKFPTGYWDPHGKEDQPNYYLDAMYRLIPAEHRDLIGPSDNPGADVLKLSAGEAMGLKLHYYVQVNLAGFAQLVEALGGITVNINYRVPVGGNDDKKIPASRYLEPGPDRHLNGTDALWFARGRYQVQGADVARQARQRCTVKAIVERATPQNVLANYMDLAKAGENLIRTDIPQTILPAFVTLGQRVKNAQITNIDLNKPKNYPSGSNPKYEAMRKLIQQHLNPTTKPAAPKPTASTPHKPTTPKTPAPDLAEACAYNPEN
ncbi:LCP family protein [Kribbella sp. NPDC058245]|uniref:LCP family glycopolymer transferase n=1 Tax=Kribbella sp. NPDC058245 TaxID=3346399 RepID=UPI0036ED500B